MHLPEEKTSVPAVSVIIERTNPLTKKTEILIQKRNKPSYDPKYTGCWEIAGGRIREFEDVKETVKREVKEETGLDVKEIEIGQSNVIENQGDKAFCFKPFCCYQILKGPHPYVGFAFIAKVTGEIKESDEAKDAKWVDFEKLKNMLQNEKFYILNIPTLKLYLAERGFPKYMENVFKSYIKK
jgi:8-oxo-dGTP pyrophosphatase MutT (NUDIX family)